MCRAIPSAWVCPTDYLMSTPPQRSDIFHIVHVDRLDSVIADGKLFSDSAVRSAPRGGTMIGMGSIKQERLRQPVRCHEGDCVGDYVPFYFCSRSIMLYVIHKANHPELTYRGGQGPIVHLQADVHEAVAWAGEQARRWAFTTSNARAHYTAFYDDLKDLDQIDWNAVASSNWTAAEVRERKQAEFLMHNSFPWELVRRIGVHSQAMYAHVQAVLKNSGHKPKVEIKPDWYY